MKKHGLGQPYWNAHQVYSWVHTRNPRLVVLLSDRDEGDSFDPNLIDFLAMANRPGAEFADYAEAQEAIVSTLQEGRLRSWGRREGVGTLEEIPTLEWANLHFVWYVFHGLVEAVGMTDNPPSSIVGAPRWYGLRFKRDDVLELWPPTETEIETGAEDPPAQTLPPHDEPDPPEPAETPVPEGSDDESGPPRKKPAELMHKRWITRAKELREADKKMKVSEIASKIRREDTQSKDPNTRGETRDKGTIRRVLARQKKWNLPPES